ncbi:MAG: glycosyltransferase [Balneolaceae bacterium]
MKQKIGFIYYTFSPVTGGAAVHGWNLAKELNSLGYRLYKLNGGPDPWTEKKPENLAGLIWILRHCELIYVRMDFFFNLRNLIGFLSILLGKKTVVELNTPSDELHLFGRSPAWIRWIDRIWGLFLRRADAVTVVSEPVARYCREALSLERVQVIENGGEIFDPVALHPDPAVRDEMESIRKKYRTVVVWAGSSNAMQDLEAMEQIAEAASPETAIVLLVQEDLNGKKVTAEGENIFIFRNMERDTVKYIIRESEIGVAFYREYPWSRWGFYNSSLKVMEYLNNGLLALANIEGTEVQRNHPNFRQVSGVEEAAAIIRSFRGTAVDSASSGTTEVQPARTWADAASETSELIQSILTP